MQYSHIASFFSFIFATVPFFSSAFFSKFFLLCLIYSLQFQQVQLFIQHPKLRMMVRDVTIIKDCVFVLQDVKPTDSGNKRGMWETKKTSTPGKVSHRCQIFIYCLCPIVNPATNWPLCRAQRDWGRLQPTQLMGILLATFLATYKTNSYIFSLC